MLFYLFYRTFSELKERYKIYQLKKLILTPAREKCSDEMRMKILRLISSETGYIMQGDISDPLLNCELYDMLIVVPGKDFVLDSKQFRKFCGSLVASGKLMVLLDEEKSLRKEALFGGFVDVKFKESSIFSFELNCRQPEWMNAGITIFQHS